MLQKKPQPVSQLFELCQKNGQQVDIKQTRENDKTTASIYIDNKLIVSASSDQKDNAKLHAATAALEKMDIRSSFSENGKIGTAKRKLEQFSLKKKWAKPTYRYKFLSHTNNNNNDLADFFLFVLYILTYEA